MNAFVTVALVSLECLFALGFIALCAMLRYGWVEGQATVKAVPPWKRKGPEPKSAPRAEADGGDPS